MWNERHFVLSSGRAERSYSPEVDFSQTAESSEAPFDKAIVI
jgi:hypothetical protein